MPQSLEALRSLKAVLLEFQTRGGERIWITETARQTLATFPSRLAATTTAANRASAAAATPSTDAPRDSGPCFKTGLNPKGDSPAERLASLKEIAAEWRAARALDSLRDTMVFAVGNPSADLMFVGEAPGADEEQQREPFVGKAGQLLTKVIQAMGLQREDVYITNICKYRPSMPDQGTGNRKPTSEEMEACLPFVLTEIDIVRPRAIVALGATAAEGLLGIHDAVGRMRSRFHDLNGIPTMVTYHPSYLLRNQAMSERRKVWEDILLVMEKLGISVTEKQRAFFTK